MDNMEMYLRPTANVDCDNSAIVEKAHSLTAGKASTAEKATSLFYFVRDAIRYNAYRFSLAPGCFRASKTLERGDGFCIQKAALLAALARSAGIPARLLFADIRNHMLPQKIVDFQVTDLLTHHGYCELFVEQRWVKVTPAFDLKTCTDNGFVPVEFDGTRDSILHSHNRDGRLHIEYVRFYGHYEDVPLEEMVSRFIEVYGPERAELLKNEFWADEAFRSA